MAMKDHATAKYRVIADSGGSRYRFFCDVSGMALCTTKPIRENTQEEELKTAWETEGRQHFLHSFGRLSTVSEPIFYSFFIDDESLCMIFRQQRIKST